jgi:hypothetical protein
VTPVVAKGAPDRLLALTGRYFLRERAALVDKGARLRRRTIARGSIASLAMLGAALIAGFPLGACSPAAPSPTDVPTAIAALLVDAAPADATGAVETGGADSSTLDGSNEAATDAAPRPSAPVSAFFCGDASTGVAKRGSSPSAADAATVGRSAAKSAARFAPLDAASAFTPPLRLFSDTRFSGVEVGVASSVLDLSAFPDDEGRCRSFPTPPRSFHLEVGYSAAFYAQHDYLNECARVDASIDHDSSDLTSKCPQVASIRLVKGALDSGVEQPARQ